MITRLRAAAFLVGIVAAGSGPAALRAQSAQPFSIQLSPLAASQKIGAKAVNGFGFEGQFRYTAAARWSIGAGYQYSTHETGDDKIQISGLFLEPRIVITVWANRFAPYAAGRLAFLNEKLTLGEQSGSEFSSNGFAFGGGGGVLVRLTSRLNFDVGLAFVRQSFDDATVDLTTVKFPAFTGYVFKPGFSFGFGSR